MKKSINLWAVTADAPGAVLLGWTLDIELDQALAGLPSDLRRCVRLVDVKGRGVQEDGSYSRHPCRHLAVSLSTMAHEAARSFAGDR